MLVSTDLMGLGICPGPKTLTRDEGITISWKYYYFSCNDTMVADH
jgi:hypothetical protein